MGAGHVRRMAALFDLVAEEYDQHVPFFAAYARQFVPWLEVRPGDRFLDIGIGRGAVAREAEEAGARVVGVDVSVVMLTKSHCPDHRAWVQTLAGVAFLGVITALVALWRGWAAGPLLTLVAGLAGVAIGFLDAVHSPTRGRLVAVGFAAATMLAAVMALRAWRLARWDPAATAPSVLDHDRVAKPVEVPAEITPQSPVVPADEASNRA